MTLIIGVSRVISLLLDCDYQIELVGCVESGKNEDNKRRFKHEAATG